MSEKNCEPTIDTCPGGFELVCWEHGTICTFKYAPIKASVIAEQVARHHNQQVRA